MVAGLDKLLRVVGISKEVTIRLRVRVKGVTAIIYSNFIM